MLAHLRIRNLALVDDLTWELSPGLIGVTGETGAGKSVIVGGLKLIIGERADRSLIRSGSDQCEVEAVFALTPELEERLAPILEDAGLPPCEDSQLMIRRVLAASGANRQFVNCSSATLQVLKSLGDILVDLHGPHDHQSLLSRDHQLALLDAYAGAGEALAAYKDAYSRWRRLQRQWEEMRDSEEASAHEIELLRHQLDEISNADIRPEEEEEIQDRYRRASNSVRLVELSGGLVDALSDADINITGQLADLQRLVRELERLDPSSTEITAGLSRASLELDETSALLRDYRDALEIDPQEAGQLEDRIHVFETLKRKYGGTLEAVLASADHAARRLEMMENRDEALAKARAEADAAKKVVAKTGGTLGKMRRAAATPLAAEIAAHLADLGFKQAEFSIAFTEEESPGPHGCEQVDFQFMPNPGEAAKPLRLIASSGEISRVMLAVKTALAEQDGVPLLVFDEIDANVGGEIATSVGSKLASLARRHQVITITHLPQVASKAQSQFRVIKVVEDNRTHSRLLRVEGDAREEELARMLGGKSENALKLAKSLLAGLCPAGKKV